MTQSTPNKLFLRLLACVIVLSAYLPLSRSFVSNVAFNKPTTQSSTLRYRDNNPTDPFSWDSHLAVDGRKYTRVSSAVVRTPLCSATDDGAMPAWWQVDLVSTYEIQQIAIYGRATVPPEQLRGFTLYISNSTYFKVHPNIVYIDETTEKDYNNNNGIIRIQSLNNNHLGRYVTVELTQGNTSLTLCEVEVFAGCGAGMFGQNCTTPCHCLNNKKCDRINGSCPDNVCAPGWKSDDCSIECDEGTFGQNCSYLCHCLNHKACDRITGICPGNVCTAGWSGADCSIDVK